MDYLRVDNLFKRVSSSYNQPLLFFLNLFPLSSEIFSINSKQRLLTQYWGSSSHISMNYLFLFHFLLFFLEQTKILQSLQKIIEGVSTMKIIIILSQKNMCAGFNSQIVGFSTKKQELPTKKIEILKLLSSDSFVSAFQQLKQRKDIEYSQEKVIFVNLFICCGFECICSKKQIGHHQHQQRLNTGGMGIRLIKSYNRLTLEGSLYKSGNISHLLQQQNPLKIKIMPFPIKYAHYTLEQRIELVTLVQDNELSINQAAKEVGINPSTAKLIIKKYRREGTFAMRKVRQVPDEPQISLQQPQPPKQVSNNDLIIPSPEFPRQSSECEQNFMIWPDLAPQSFPLYNFYYFLLSW